MINIKTNNITSVTVDSENANFPITQVLDKKVKRVYKAVDGVNEATIVAAISGTSNSFTIAGTNAVAVSITAENPTSLTWATGMLWATGTSWVTTDIALEVDLIQRSSSNALWAQLGNDLPSAVILNITCTAPVGETLEIGVLEVGFGTVFIDPDGESVNPDFGLVETKKDYSIDDEFSNGSGYYFSRDKVRKFEGVVKMSYESGDAFMESYNANGKIPTGWRITDLSSNRWVVFAKFTDPPVVTYSNFNEVTVSFSLTEVL